MTTPVPVRGWPDLALGPGLSRAALAVGQGGCLWIAAPVYWPGPDRLGVLPAWLGPPVWAGMLVCLLVWIWRPQRAVALGYAVLALLGTLVNVHAAQPYTAMTAGVLLLHAYRGEGAARALLAPMYLWAGLAKLDGQFAAAFGLPTMLGSLGALLEASCGLLLLGGQARTGHRLLAGLHLGLLAVLALASYNPVVWPWQLALIGLHLRLAGQPAGALPRAPLAGLLLAPLLYWTSGVGSVLAWNLYSGHTDRVRLSTAYGFEDAGQRFERTYGAAPLPEGWALHAYAAGLTRRGAVQGFEVLPRRRGR